MEVLLTRPAHDRFWSAVSRPELVPLVMEADGTVSRPGDGAGAGAGAGAGSGAGDGAAAAGEASPEVAWGTSDLFLDGGPLGRFLRQLVDAPSLQWFQSPGAGFDAPVFAQLAGRGVRVTNAHVNGIPIAEYVLRSVLDHFQAAARWREAQAAGRWELHDYREVAGTTWLVVGLGSIGGGVARRAAAFGARVIGCRRRPHADDPADRTVTPDELPGVVGEADVVVLAAPATAATAQLVDDRFLAAMRPGSVLVNVARGSLVDERALLAALDRGVPEAAVLDVFAVEPLPSDHPFWSHPAVTLTPHNAAGGTGRYERQAALFADNLDRYLAGEPLVNDVTADILDQRGGA